MRFRKLRIAWSVAWGLPAALLIVLWVQSYSHTMSFAASFPRSGLCAALDSTRERVLISASTTGGGKLQPYLPGNQRRKIDAELWNLIRASENMWIWYLPRLYTYQHVYRDIASLVFDIAVGRRCGRSLDNFALPFQPLRSANRHDASGRGPGIGGLGREFQITPLARKRWFPNQENNLL
jgi:hypothetical protein